MYPFVSWRRDKVVARLEALLVHDFHYEAVVVSTQVIEQLLKRALVGSVLHHWPGGLKPATRELARAERERIYRLQLSSLAANWRKALPDKKRLPQLVDDAVAPAAWDALFFNQRDRAKQEPRRSFGALFDGEKVPFGLLRSRHQLTHGGYPPPERLVHLHAAFGLQVVSGLTRAFAGSEWRDPFAKLPALKLR